MATEFQDISRLSITEDLQISSCVILVANSLPVKLGYLSLNCEYEDFSVCVKMRNQRRISEGTSSLLNIKLKSQATLCGCTARFVSGLVLNPDDIFSRDIAHMKQY